MEFQLKNWKCPKCANQEYESSSFIASPGVLNFFGKPKKFISITCKFCFFTELYRAKYDVKSFFTGEVEPG